VRDGEQARHWIGLWCDLREFTLTDFIISEFLPGRDYAFQSVWKDGRMVVGKMIERLSYFFGRNMLSGMSSSPSIARTLLDRKTFEEVILKAIHGICDHPHGNFNLDLKGRADGTMCVTELNIGRFCMITPIFDRTGRYNTAEMHVRCALGLDVQVDDPLDYEDGCYLIRELDTLPTILRGDEFKARLRAAEAINPGGKS
jgi:carbamoyl-phosphate synthase large subunit